MGGVELSRDEPTDEFGDSPENCRAIASEFQDRRRARHADGIQSLLFRDDQDKSHEQRDAEDRQQNDDDDS